MKRPEFYSLGRLEEEEWRKEEADVAPSEARFVFNQTTIGTVSRAALAGTAERTSLS